MKTDLLWVLVAFLIGGILNFWLGWAKSQEPFNLRKFISTLIIVAASAVGTVGLYSQNEFISIQDLVAVFGLGYACDGIIKTGTAVVASRISPVKES